MVIKYKVEVGFKDKYTGEKIKKDTVLDIDIKRMRELNEKGKGRVIDIIIDNEIVDEKSEKTQETKQENVQVSKTNVKYSEKELEEKTVNELKDIAEKEGYELTKATKKEIIKEILEFQK